MKGKIMEIIILIAIILNAGTLMGEISKIRKKQEEILKVLHSQGMILLELQKNQKENNVVNSQLKQTNNKTRNNHCLEIRTTQRRSRSTQEFSPLRRKTLCRTLAELFPISSNTKMTRSQIKLYSMCHEIGLMKRMLEK